MPNIKPSTEIRNHYPEYSRFCKETGEPIYLTVNGKGDTALIDIDTLYAKVALYEKLSAGIRDVKEGKVKSHEEVFSKFRK